MDAADVVAASSLLMEEAPSSFTSRQLSGIKLAGPPNTRLVRQKRCPADCSGRARCCKKRRVLTRFDSEDEAEEEAEPPAAGIYVLPAELLVKIFGCLEAKAHRFVLPLVCKEWHKLLQQPLSLYKHLDVDFAAEVPTDNAEQAVINSGALLTVRETSVTAWVRQRASAVRSLRMRGSFEPGIGRARHPQTDNLHNFTGDGLANLLMAVADPLEELVIECCQQILSPPPFSAISYIPNLTVLILKGICVPLSEQDFCGIAKLRHLQELVLDCEQPPETEEGVEEIKWGLQSFPEGMLHLTNMTHLTLTCQYGVTQLPVGISKLNKLEVLNLDFCTLSKLPASLGQLTALTTLDLEGNALLGELPLSIGGVELSNPAPAFPQELEKLEQLRYLNLTSCHLERVPEVVSSFSSLVTLDIENNNFSEEAVRPGSAFPASLSALSRVQCLNVAKCQLVCIPDVISSFGALRVLDLTSNQLTNETIPTALTKLSHLKAIGLKNNLLTRVPPLLGRISSLQEIYLEDNPAMEVDQHLDFLVALPNLRLLLMGKQEGSWHPASMHFIADLAFKLHSRQRDREVLRISYPGFASVKPAGGYLSRSIQDQA